MVVVEFQVEKPGEINQRVYLMHSRWFLGVWEILEGNSSTVNPSVAINTSACLKIRDLWGNFQISLGKVRVVCYK